MDDPLPRISGRVVDGNGDGVANAQVQVVGTAEASVSTDATGKFELRRYPGVYMLSVTAPISLKAPDREPDTGRTMAWTRAFYPGVAGLESATRIVAPPGGEVSDLEIKLLAVPSHAVRGIVLNPDGTPAPKVTVALGEDPAPCWYKQGQPAYHTESNSDGAFEFPAVVDGEWRLSIELPAKNENRPGPLGPSQWIEMAGQDIEDAKIRVASPFTLSGKELIEIPQGMRSPEPFPVLLIPHGRSTHGDIGMLNWMLWPQLYFEPAIPQNLAELAREAHNAFKEITTNQFRELGAILATPSADNSFNLENV